MNTDNQNYTVIKGFHPLTLQPLWTINDISLALGEIIPLIQEFISENYHPDYTLHIFDEVTTEVISIDCSVDNIPKIVDYIYHLEKGTPLTFIGSNELTESYEVGMSITRGNIQFGFYKDENGKLIRVK